MENISNKEFTQLWNTVYNLSLQMLHNELDAEEATQSIFEKVLKNLSSFKNHSKLSTWIYRISYNFLIDEKRKKKTQEISFDLFENDVTNFESYNNELGLSINEEKIYIEEIKVGCTLAILQCLSPQNRFIYIIATIFNFPGTEAAEICNMDYDSYRKRVSRIKEKIKCFMEKNCGLINPHAECKCRKRILIAIERGRINHERMLYQNDNHLIKNYISEMNEIDEIARIYRNNPFIERSDSEISRIIDKFSVLREIS